MSEVSNVHAACYLARLYEYNTNCPTRKYPMLEVSKKKFKPIHKATFKIFICHVESVEGSVHIH